MIKKALLASLILAVCIFIFGCGQTASVITSTNQPTGLTIRGTVRYIVFNNVTFVPGAPVPGAEVKIDGGGQSLTTRAGSDGSYSFTNIPDGQYSITATAEGILYFAPAVTVSIKPSNLTPADNTITTADIFLYRFAITTGYSPATGSTISRDQTFTVTFNAPMDTSTVRFSLVPQGLRTQADNGDTVQVDLTWTDSNRTVAIAPQGELLPNQKYRLMMSYINWTNSNSMPLDAQGGKYISGDGYSWTPFVEFLPHFADYQTIAEGVPGAPSSLQVVVNGKTTSEIDVQDVLTLANKVQLNWVPASGNISGYKLYVARSGSVLNYFPLESDTATNNVTTESYFTSDISKVITALYGSTAQVSIDGTNNYPFEQTSVYFKVVAYNGDGESIGPEVEARDKVGPKTGIVIYNGLVPLPGVLPDNYIVEPIYSDEIIAGILGPLDSATVIPSNFAITKDAVPVNILSVEYLVNYIGAVYLKIKADTPLDTSLSTYIITLQTGLKDICGNPVSAGVSDTLTWSPP